jgi:hypothetical protein
MYCYRVIFFLPPLFFYCFWIRDGKNPEQGSGINIPTPQKCSCTSIYLSYYVFYLRYGRVNYVLAKRLELLDEVSRLQKSLGVQGDVAFTCETARYCTGTSLQLPYKLSRSISAFKKP